MKLANKKSISIILSSCFLLTLFSCSQNNNPVDEPDEPVIDEKEDITFKFNYDEKLQILNDKLKEVLSNVRERLHNR